MRINYPHRQGNFPELPSCYYIQERKRQEVLFVVKVCKKCGEEKPATNEYFRKAKRNRDGLSGSCRKCATLLQREYNYKNRDVIMEQQKLYNKVNSVSIAEYHKQYRQLNDHSIKENLREYYQENNVVIKERSKLRYQENKEEIKEQRKGYFIDYRKNNIEAIAKRTKNYRDSHKEYNSAWHKQYGKNNRDKCNVITQRYRARKRKLPSTLTTLQWEQIKKYFNNECAYCGESSPLAQEHHFPLVLGGEYAVSNIVPSCRRCNSSKGPKLFSDWYKHQDYYDKQRESKILNYLGYKDSIQQLSFV